jgi:hypothetical protein
LRIHRLLVGSALVALAVAACGASGGSPDASVEPSSEPGASVSATVSSPSTAPSASTSAEPAPSGAASPGSSGGPEPSASDDGAFVAPTVADGRFPTGKAFVRVRGDVDTTVEADRGSGFAAGGTLIGSFATSAGDASIQLGLNVDGASAIVIQTTKFATGGTFGEECSLDVTRNDATAFEASFRCEAVAGVDVATTNAYELDLAGTIAMQR